MRSDSDDILLIDHKTERCTCICSPSVGDCVVRVWMLEMRIPNIVSRSFTIDGICQWDVNERTGNLPSAALGIQSEESDLAFVERLVGVGSHSLYTKARKKWRKQRMHFTVFSEFCAPGLCCPHGEAELFSELRDSPVGSDNDLQPGACVEKAPQWV